MFTSAAFPETVFIWSGYGRDSGAASGIFWSGPATSGETSEAGAGCAETAADINAMRLMLTFDGADPAGGAFWGIRSDCFGPFPACRVPLRANRKLPPEGVSRFRTRDYPPLSPDLIRCVKTELSIA